MKAPGGIFILLYRMCLTAYPKEFRSDSAPEMMETLRVRELEARGAGGRLTLTRFRLRELAAVVRTGLRFRFGRILSSGSPVEITVPRPRLRILTTTLVHDIRYGLRNMRMHPLFSSVAVVTLALGIGATTTIYSLINGVLLRPLPYEDSENLVIMWERLASFPDASVSYPNFLDWRNRNTVFEDMGAYNSAGLNLTGEGDPVELRAARISASTFEVVRTRPMMGRAFTEEEDKIGGERVAVLTWGFWQNMLGGDTEVVGRTLTLDDLTYTVVGVMPHEFVYPPNVGEVDIYVPIEQFAGNWINQRGNHPGIAVVGRLKQGATVEQMEADLERVAHELEEENPDTNTGSRVNSALLQDRLNRNIREPLLLLLLAVSFLLLIACANVANLLLSRATFRQHEVAVRSTLGAESGHIMKLLVTESVTLWLLGGVAGIIIALFTTRLISAAVADNIPRIFRLGLESRVIVVTLIVTLITGILFGLAPALRLRRPNLQQFLREGSRMSTGRGRHRMQNFLVVVEVTLAVVLLVGAGLTLRSFSKMTGASPGLEAENVLTVEVGLPAAGYTDPAQRTTFFYNLLERVRPIPGVLSAATTYVMPLSSFSGWQSSFHAEGQPPEQPGESTMAEISSVSPDYFRTMSIPLLRGRDFTVDDGGQNQPVAVIDETLAGHFWPDEDPLGKRLKFGHFDDQYPWLEIVGVVGHVKLNGVTNDADWQFYIPHQQDNDLAYYLVVKTAGDPLQYVEAIRAEVLALDSSLPISNIRTMQDYVRSTTERDGFMAVLLSIFASTALILAAIGLYGVMSYATTERNHEIGIRMAMGARNRQVLGMVIREGMLKVLLGVTIGLPLAACLGIILRNRLFGVTAIDPVTFVLAPLFLCVIALIANALPARRAANLDPVETLRGE